MTRTYAVVELSPASYKELRDKLVDAGYGGTRINRRGEIDLEGLCAAPEKDPSQPVERDEEERLP